MERRRENLLRRALLDDAAEIHHDHAVGEVADDRKIVADEDHRRLRLTLQIHQQFADRRLHGDVERGHRLVRNDQARLAGEGAGDPDPLLLAARQLPGHAGCESAREFDHVEQPQHGPAALVLAGADAEALQRAHYLRSHGVAGIQRVERILEDHLNGGDRLDVAPLDRGALNGEMIERSRAAGRDLQPEQHFGERRFTATGFADDRDGLGFVGDETDVLDRLDRARLSPAEYLGSGDLIVLLQIDYVENPPADRDRRRLFGWAGAVAPVDGVEPQAAAEMIVLAENGKHRHFGVVAHALEKI